MFPILADVMVLLINNLFCHMMAPEWKYAESIEIARHHQIS